MPTGIIGATGFIGSYLSRHHLAGPLRILSRSAAQLPAPLGAEAMQGDLLSRQDCERFASGLDVIYYLAHTNTPLNSDLDQPADAALNLVPFLTLLSAIRQLRRKPHLVYFGSGGAVYAPNRARVPYREGDACAPASSYGILKLAAEQYLRLAAWREELTAVVLRVGNAYGTLLPQFRKQGLIGVAIGQLLDGKPVQVFGNPGNVRDYVHLEDIRAMVLAASVPRRPFDLVNVGSGEGHSVDDVLGLIRESYGADFAVQADAGSAGWLADWVVLDSSYAKREYGWSPSVSLRQGIAGMLAEARDPARRRPALAR